MKNTRSFFMVAVLFSVAALLAALPGRLSSQQAAAVRVDADDVGGMVTSAKGPEAGVVYIFACWRPARLDIATSPSPIAQKEGT